MDSAGRIEWDVIGWVQKGAREGGYCMLCYSFPSHSLKLLIKIA